MVASGVAKLIKMAIQSSTFHRVNLSLYIHIPWCLHKCSYCDFYSLPAKAHEVPGRGYVDHLINELDMMLGVTPVRRASRCRTLAEWGTGERQGPKHRFHSIFLGGGTPSMIPPRELGRLLEEVARKFEMPEEITIEANPETLDDTILRELRAAGFTRLSCGVQSFDPQQLEFLERVHSSDKARDALRAARRAGFQNRSLDLIYALPNQTMADLENDLREAIELEPTHISAYQLTVEPGTPLERKVRNGVVQPPDEETTIAMWHRVREILVEAGYGVYEISNFAQPGFECVHNIHYWEYGDYLGLGAGAVSRIGNHRWRRACNVRAFLTKDEKANNEQQATGDECMTSGEIDFEEWLTSDQMRTEFCMLGLRMTRGLDLPQFTEHFGKSFEAFYPGKIATWKQKGLAACDTHLQLTPSGMLILDSLVSELI